MSGTLHGKNRTRNDPILAWLKDARDTVVKQGDLETASTVRVSVLTWEEAPLAEGSLPPFVPLDDFARWLGAGLLPRMAPDLRKEAVLLAERRWVVHDVPDRELLDALSHGFAVFYLLVAEAHQRSSGRCEMPVVDGRLPCMIATREMRSTRLNLRTGVGIPVEVLPWPSSEHEKREAWQRYKLSSLGPVEVKDAVGVAQRQSELAKRMLVRDGTLAPVVLLLRGLDILQQILIPCEDQQDKSIPWRRIADEVRRTGADGVIFSGEVWFLRGAAKDRAVREHIRPLDSPDLEEAIAVSVATATTAPRSYVTPFSRGWFGRIKLELTDEETGGVYNYLAPVCAAWAERAGGNKTGT
jgi:hypothetical protein